MRERLTDEQLVEIQAQMRATRDPDDPATRASLDMIEELLALREVADAANDAIEMGASSAVAEHLKRSFTKLRALEKDDA